MAEDGAKAGSKTKNLERFLHSVGKQVVNRAKANLQKKKRGSKLEQSIKYKIVEQEGSKGSFVIQFIMYNYGKFIDKGVSGTKKRRQYKDKENKFVSSPYRFGTGSARVGKSKGGMSGIMAKWVKKKGFQWKDKETGRFMSHKSMGYLIARSIYSKGIQGISFFQKPFGLAMKTFGQGVAQAMAQDIADNIKNNKNKNKQ